MGALRGALAAGAAAAAAAAAAAGLLLAIFPYPPHGRPLPGGRVAINWDARTPRLLQAVNRAMLPWHRDVTQGDAADLIAAAQERTGLTDFGDEDARPFREGLDRFLAAHAAGPPLTPVGAFYRREQTRGYLSTRLRVEALLKAHPEILGERVDAPIFVVGLPRSGTTHLLRVLAAHPDLRCLPLWEAMDPVRPPAGPDRRLQTAEVAMWIQGWTAPLLKALHPMEPLVAHEDIHLFAVSFASWMLETEVNEPAYGEWYEAADHTPAYRYFRLLLQVLQWQDRGGGLAPRRWVLKTPQHAEQYAALFRVFPDARVVATHRDPVPCVASFLPLVTYALLGGYQAGLQPRRTAEYWVPRMERMLRRSIAARAALPNGTEAQIVDVHFSDLVADNYAAAERACDAAGVAVGADAAAAMRRSIAAHPRDEHGRLWYDLEPFGVDAAALAARLRFYRDHFGVAEEPLQD